MQSRTKKYLLALVGVAVIGGMIAESQRSPEDHAAWEAAGDRAHAEGTCVRALKQKANDPASVEVDRVLRYVVKGDGKTATIAISMRAKNAMGGLVMTTLECSLVRDGKNWKAISAVSPA